MLHAELLVELWIGIVNAGPITFPKAQMCHLKWNVYNWVVPCLCFVECSEGSDLKILFIPHVCEFASIAQLSLQQVVVSIKLSLDRKVRLDMGHFAK